MTTIVRDPPRRIDGYAPLSDYAAIGDGRTMALVARDGSIDWLCLPDMDSPAVFAALLDADRGGTFQLAPVSPCESSRRYLPGTNVLETTFHTEDGTVRVTDAMTLPGKALSPQREVVRTVQTDGAEVPMRWQVVPRFGYGATRTRITRRAGMPVAVSGAHAMAVCSWDTGEPTISAEGISGRFDATARPAIFSLCSSYQEPLVLPSRRDVEDRLTATTAWWQDWSRRFRPTRAWSGEVVRSALVLKLLVHAPSGAIAAAGTTSLPETIGGERNWDYRFCWVRDAAFVLGALLRLGCIEEADSFFWWLMQASQLTHPRLQVLYRLDGGTRADERSLPLAGYRGSSPVRVGNGAASQVQLDVYGDLFQAAWLYAEAGRPIDPDIGRRLGEMADLVCDIWRQPDAGLWEVRSAPQHFTQSKMMCAIALDRAVRLAHAGALPSRHIPRWESEAREIRAFVEERCWSDARQSYLRSAGSDDLDASLLLGVLFAYADPHGARLCATVEAVRRELSHGPFVHRYTGEDGLAGDEGAFLTCSFWLAEALAAQGRRGEARTLMDGLVGLANDVGLYAEEIDPATGAFLGNLPQALSHLALVHAALAFEGGEAQ